MNRCVIEEEDSENFLKIYREIYETVSNSLEIHGIIVIIELNHRHYYLDL